MRIWDLKTGRCTKTVDAHSHFVTSLAWGRARVDGGSGIGSAGAGGGAPAPDGADAKVNGNGNGKMMKEEDVKIVNVVATCSVDQTIRIWSP